MELGTREILLAVGLLLIVVIVWDGVRRMRQSGRGQIRMARRQRVFDEDSDGYDPYGGELSGEVRVRERGEREVPTIRSGAPLGQRSTAALEEDDDPLMSRSAPRERPRRDQDLRSALERGPVEQYEPSDTADEQSLFEEEQHELAFDMPQQEAFDLSKEIIPTPVRTPIRRRSEAAEPIAEDFGVANGERVSYPEDEDFARQPAQENRSSARVPAGEQAAVAGESASREERRRDAPMPEVVALHVMAARSGYFRGEDLLDEFMANDLRYGSMKIFHRHQEPDGVGPVLFSLANSVKPGTFDLNAMDGFSTPGISLFMALDDLDNPSDAFEQLLKVAHNLAAGLGGELKDESRSALTRQTEDHCRQRIQEFERRRLYRTTQR